MPRTRHSRYSKSYCQDSSFKEGFELPTRLEHRARAKEATRPRPLADARLGRTTGSFRVTSEEGVFELPPPNRTLNSTGCRPAQPAVVADAASMATLAPTMVRMDRATRGASRAISRSAPVGGFLKPTKYNPAMPVSSPNRLVCRVHRQSSRSLQSRYPGSVYSRSQK